MANKRLNKDKQTATANNARSKKGERKRTEILETARAVLLDEGHAAFTTRRIADRLGINLGHLYYYFPTKNSLVRALAEQIEDSYELRYATIFNASDKDQLNQFTNFIDFLLDDAYNPQILRFTISFWALLEQESDENHNLIYEAYDLDRERLCKFLKPLSQLIPPAELAERTAILIAMLEGLTLMVRDNSDALPGIRKKAHSLARRLIMDPDLFKHEEK